MQGNIGGAVSAEANAWGLGGASATAGAFATGGASSSSHGCTSRSGHSRALEYGSESRHSRAGGSFEKTTTQTRVGADGSFEQKTTHTRASEAKAGYGGHGECGRQGHHGSGYDRSYQHTSVRSYDHGHESAAWRSGGSGYSHSGAMAAGGSFAAASVSIQPTGLLSLFGGLLGGAGQPAA
ncbi:hypothetical protein [Paraburkholderia rhizosphaerae]|nr:hypothetical protein [Paraburkholderia rhizosphaerae]